MGMSSSPRLRTRLPGRKLAASGSLDSSRLLRSPEPPRVLPRQGTQTGPILTDKYGMFPRRGESHILPASQKGPMMPQRPRCLNQERSHRTLTAAKPPFTPHVPVPVCSSLTPRQLRPKGVTENVFSVDSIEHVDRSTPEPAGSPRSPKSQGSTDVPSSSTSIRGRGIGHDIDPWSASHSMPSWEPTAQVGVRINAERRADRFKADNAVVPSMPNERMPRYYASSGMDSFGESTQHLDGAECHRGETKHRATQEWIEDATKVPEPLQFTPQRAGFNLPGSSDDGFRVARARQQFYEQVRQLGPCRSEPGFAMVRTPPSQQLGAVSQRTLQAFKLSSGIAVATEERLPSAAQPLEPPAKTSSDWHKFKKALHSQREPSVLTQPRPTRDENISSQWPPRESITFRSCVERGLLPVAGIEPATVDSGLPRATIIARQARQY